MKTNKILMAVALPALLAACTAEEVVEQSQVANLSNRAMLDSNFSVNVAEGVDSRFAWEGLNWKYEAGDQFGAGVVDPAELGTVSETSMIGNYIFTKNEAGAYKTNSQMQEGHYMFYSYGGFDKKNVRSLVSFDITSQKTDLSEPEAMINDYANQLMFSPIYDIEAEYSAEAMPLEFRSFWGVAAFKFKNNTGQTLRINQIILKEAGSAAFIVKGGINPKTLHDAGLEYVYNENGAKYNGTKGKANEHNYVPAAVNALINKELTATFTEAKRLEQIEDAYEAFEAKLYTTEASKDVNENGSSSFIAMNCQNYKMKHGETVTAYMLVPAHDGKNLSVEIMVVDEEDESWSVFVEDEQITGSKDVEGLDGLNILRHKTNAIFGKTTDGKGMKTLSIVEDDLEENSGYYIDNNTALKDLINANLGKITVHNTGDTYIDKDIVEAIKEYTGTHVTFSNAIEIKSAEALVYDAETGEDLSLSQITFKGGAIVKGKNAKKEINGTVAFGSSVKFAAEQTLVVEENANVTLTSGNYANIKNNGNLVVEKNVKGIETEARATVVLPVSLVNEAGSATLKIDEVNVVAKAGSVSFSGANNNVLVVDASQLDIKAGANLTIGQNVTLNIDADKTVASSYDAETATWTKSTLTNNGTINIETGKTLTVTNVLVNNAVIEGAGKLETKKAEGTKKDNTKVYTEPTITNAADGEVSVATIIVDENTTVTNAGEFGWDSNSTAVEVYGEVVMSGAASRLEVTKCEKTVGTGETAVTYAGEVNNSENGVVKAPEGMLIAATVGAMTDGETLKSFDIDGQINKIIVTDTWTITANKENKTAKEALDDLKIKEVEFRCKNAVDVRSNAVLDLSGVVVKMHGVEKVIFSGRTAETSTLILAAEPVACVKWWKNNTDKYQPETAVYNNITVNQSAASVLAAIAKGGSYTLKFDVTEELVFEEVGTGAILNLGDKNIITEGTAITVKKGALTIQGDTKKSIVKSTGKGKYAAVQANGSDAKVIINGGTYTAGVREADADGKTDGNAAVETRNGGKVEILDGYFYAADIRYHNGRPNVYFVLNNDDEDNTGAQMVVKGGKFLNFNPAKPLTEENENYNYVNAGYHVDSYKDEACNQFYHCGSVSGWNSSAPTNYWYVVKKDNADSSVHTK